MSSTERFPIEEPDRSLGDLVGDLAAQVSGLVGNHIDLAKAELRDADVSYNTFEKLRDPSHMRCLTLGEWLELLEDAGFEIRHREVPNKTMNFID